jgi:hypothetical protein
MVDVPFLTGTVTDNQLSLLIFVLTVLVTGSVTNMTIANSQSVKDRSVFLVHLNVPVLKAGSNVLYFVVSGPSPFGAWLLIPISGFQQFTKFAIGITT